VVNVLIVSAFGYERSLSGAALSSFLPQNQSSIGSANRFENTILPARFLLDVKAISRCKLGPGPDGHTA
jgi:hypothetical protein